MRMQAFIHSTVMTKTHTQRVFFLMRRTNYLIISLAAAGLSLQVSCDSLQQVDRTQATSAGKAGMSRPQETLSGTKETWPARCSGLCFPPNQRVLKDSKWGCLGIGQTRREGGEMRKAPSLPW